VAFNNAGTYTITVSSSGNGTYSPATATTTITVSLKAQYLAISANSASVTAGNIDSFSAGAYEDAALTKIITNPSGNYHWTIAATSGGPAPMSPATTTNTTGNVTFGSAGSYQVSVSNDGNSTYQPATTVSTTVQVHAAGGGSEGKKIIIAATVSPKPNYQIWFKPTGIKKAITVY
jgi:hypothetical protein